MNEAEITRYITETFSGVDVLVASRENGAPEVAWGDTFFSYDPGRDLPADRRFPFATIVTKDYGEFDSASDLNREGVFRLNVGVGKETFAALFGPKAGRPRFHGSGQDHAASGLRQDVLGLRPQPVPRYFAAGPCSPKRDARAAGKLSPKPHFRTESTIVVSEPRYKLPCSREVVEQGELV